MLSNHLVTAFPPDTSQFLLAAVAGVAASVPFSTDAAIDSALSASIVIVSLLLFSFRCCVANVIGGFNCVKAAIIVSASVGDTSNASKSDRSRMPFCFATEIRSVRRWMQTKSSLLYTLTKKSTSSNPLRCKTASTCATPAPSSQTASVSG